MKVDPVSRWIVAIGKLHSAHFAYQNGTGIKQALNCRTGCVSRGIQVVECPIATAGA